MRGDSAEADCSVGNTSAFVKWSEDTARAKGSSTKGTRCHAIERQPRCPWAQGCAAGRLVIISTAMTGGRPTRQEASDPARSNGPYETWSHKGSEEEVELIMCDGEMKIRERRGDRCSVYLKNMTRI